MRKSFVVGKLPYGDEIYPVDLQIEAVEEPIMNNPSNVPTYAKAIGRSIIDTIEKNLIVNREILVSFASLLL